MKISYKPFWDTLIEKNLNQYILIHKMGVGSSLIFRLRHDLDIRITTLLNLCEVLDCRLSDVVEGISENC